MILLLALLVSVPLSIWRGFVAAVLWGWFVVPLTGLPPIGVAMAVGIGCVTSVLFPYQITPDGEEPVAALSNRIATSVLIPLFALSGGWIALQFVDVQP